MKRTVICMIAATACVLSCSQWKLVKETGEPLVRENADNVYVISREYFRLLSDESRKAEFEKFRNEYNRILFYEKKAFPGQEVHIAKCTDVRSHEADYRHRWGMFPQDRLALESEFIFNKAAFEREVRKEKVASSGIKIISADPARLEKLMRSLNTAWNILYGEEELSFFTDGDLFSAPAKRASEIVSFLSAAGKGEISVSGKTISVKKEPDAGTESAVSAVVSLSEKRKMKTLRGRLLEMAAGTPCIRTVDERILRSETAARQISFATTDLDTLMQNIYEASNLCAEGLSSDVFEQLCSKLTSGYYSVEVRNPSCAGYCSSGYAEPFSVRVLNREGVAVSAVVKVAASKGTGTIGSNRQEYLEIPADVFSSSGAFSDFYLTSFSDGGAEIRAVLSCRDIAEKDSLFKAVFGKTVAGIMPSAALKLSNVSSFATADYERYSAGTSGGAVATVENKTISIQASENGQFTVGGFFENEPLAFLFGHPSGDRKGWIFSSYVSVKIDGKAYKLHELPSKLVEVLDKKKIIKEYSAQDGKISIREQLDITEDGNYSRISFSIANKDSLPHETGLRVLLDTWAGTNDGVPFRMPSQRKASFSQGEMITHEAEVYGLDAEYFEACERGPQRKILLKGDFCGADSTVPDRLVLASWPSAFASEWDYEPNPYKPIIFDSSVLMYFNPAEVKAGTERKISFRYGLESITDNIELPQVISTQNSVFLTSIAYHNTTDVRQHVLIEVLPDNCRIVPGSGGENLKAEIDVEPDTEAVSFFRLRASGLDKGESVVRYRIIDYNGMKEYVRKNVIADEPLIISDNRVNADAQLIPIKFSVFGKRTENSHLYAVMYDLQGQTLASEEMFDDGQHGDDAANDGVFGTALPLLGVDRKEVSVSVYEMVDRK